MSGWWNGIHRRLKISRRKAYGFESHPGHKNKKPKNECFLGFYFCSLGGDSKAGAGIQDECSECLSARRGRDTYERSELVTRDQVPSRKNLRIYHFYDNITHMRP